ncbi:MAG: hypothetical protein F8N39_13865 [Clostridiaceae bacterium]|nr:hypothetical protein [Clostridiaceae bacterium]
MAVEFSDDELELIDKLLVMYPDKIIKVLHVLDVSLYVNTYNRLRKLRGLEGPEYAKFLGFGWKTKVDLKRENDDGIIFNNKDGTTVNGKVRVLKTTYSGKYDVDVLKRLFAEFKVEQTVLANLFNVTRQFISALIKEKKPSTTSWYSDEITPLEENILELMIEEMELVCEVDDTTVFILKNDNRENCIFIKNADGVKFIKNVPEPYLSEFKEVGFDRYNDTDFKYIKKYINEGYSKGDHLKVSGKELRVPSKMKIREYVEFLGYKYISTNSRTDKEILEIMLKYKCGEDEICFTTQCPEHHMVSITLNRRGTNIEKFAEKNNYKIVSDLNRSLNAIKGYKEDLIKRQIGNGNEVYLHSYDPLYNKLQGYIKNKYKSIDEFVLELGFKRVLEVAEGYVKYDWVSEVDQNISE